MIYDPSASFPDEDPNAARSNQELQDYLDDHRVDVYYEELTPAITRPALPAVIQFKDFYHTQGSWENDVILTDATYNILTPDVSDNLVGHWSFAESINYIVRIRGKYYDLYGAAADALDSWAAELKMSFSFSLGKDQYHLKEQVENIESLSRKYRMRQWPTFVRMERSDMGAVNHFGMLDYPIFSDLK
jgi:hypothetical protein